MPRAKFVKKARVPNPVVTQEDIDAHTPENPTASYYWWKFRVEEIEMALGELG